MDKHDFDDIDAEVDRVFEGSERPSSYHHKYPSAKVSVELDEGLHSPESTLFINVEGKQSISVQVENLDGGTETLDLEVKLDKNIAVTICGPQKEHLISGYHGLKALEACVTAAETDHTKNPSPETLLQLSKLYASLQSELPSMLESLAYTIKNARLASPSNQATALDLL